MLIRYLLPLIAWIAILLLLTIRQYGIPAWQWYGSTNYSIIQCLLFLGYSHIFLGVLRKQLKYEKLRDNALVLAVISGIILSVIVEVLRYSLELSSYFNFWNLIYNCLGVFLGIGIFRLVYRTCN